MKIDTKEIKRTGIMITSRPFWMDRKAFVEANLSLANLRVKLAEALKEGREEVTVTKDETYALALHGITFAKKGSLLGKIREKFSEITMEQKKPAVKSLSSVTELLMNKYKEAYKEIAQEFVREGTVLHDEVIAEEALFNFNEELTVNVPQDKEVDVAIEQFKNMFEFAAKIRDNPYEKNLVDFYMKGISNYLKSKNVKNLPLNEQKEAYEIVYKAIAYNIHNTAKIFEDITIKGKTLSSEIIPETLDDDGIKEAQNKLIAVLREIKSKIDPDFSFANFKEEIIDKTTRAVSSGYEGVVKLCQQVVSELAEPYQALELYREKTGKNISIRHLKNIINKVVGDKADVPDNILEATKIMLEKYYNDKEKEKNKEKDTTPIPDIGGNSDVDIDIDDINFG